MQKIKQGRSLHAIGMMSGTSLDGIDLAHIVTDGHYIDVMGATASYDLPNTIREPLRGLLSGAGDALQIERDYTIFVAECVNQFCSEFGLVNKDIDVFGFHGQTIIHRPDEGITWQLGNPSLLAHRIAMPVVADFRRSDMAAGGQGAPLVPVYHAALTKKMQHPIAIVNIGGVANVTYIDGDDIIAFDTGPGNALINDWVYEHTGKDFDRGGMLAAKGRVHQEIVTSFMQHKYFDMSPPKSLDRNNFTAALDGCSLEDGAATLTAITLASIVKATSLLPNIVKQWLICGGGRHNDTMMRWLSHQLGNVMSVDELGWRGDAIEAEAFAFLAVRHLNKLPLTLPSTTGVTHPMTGGAFYYNPVDGYS